MRLNRPLAVSLPKSNPNAPGPPTVEDGLPSPRVFGVVRADLDFDFDATDRLVLATAIAARCSRADDAVDLPRRLEQAWAMPVSARIARLLRIVALTEGVDILAIALRCPDPDCAGTLEVDLPLERLLGDATGGDARAPDAAIAVEVPTGKPVQLRRPTGNDQREWRAGSFPTKQEALLAVVRSLAAPAVEKLPLGESELSLLAGAMEEVDPLTAFRVITVCPHCGKEAPIPVDLEAEALRRLANAQRAVLQEIYVLASRFGWSETEILAVPAKRRARYLRMVEASEETTP